MFKPRKKAQVQKEFWVVADRLPKASPSRFYELRGLENLNKRHQIAAACYNLSQLLRRLYGVGTPKQWRAFLQLWMIAHANLVTNLWRSLSTALQNLLPVFCSHLSCLQSRPANRGSSTACYPIACQEMDNP